jgi:hypothetical protein
MFGCSTTKKTYHFVIINQPPWLYRQGIKPNLKNMLNEQGTLENDLALRQEYAKWRKSDLIEFILELTTERLELLAKLEELFSDKPISASKTDQMGIPPDEDKAEPSGNANPFAHDDEWHQRALSNLFVYNNQK